VDGEHSLSASGTVDHQTPDEALSVEQRIELLTHRCFIRTTLPHDDLWPYADMHDAPKPA
jgi:hypothetical protein